MVSESTLEYRVYYWNSEGRWIQEDFASLTEALIRKTELKRQGITARIVGIKTTIGELTMTLRIAVELTVLFLIGFGAAWLSMRWKL